MGADVWSQFDFFLETKTQCALIPVSLNLVSWSPIAFRIGLGQVNVKTNNGENGSQIDKWYSAHPLFIILKLISC